MRSCPICESKETNEVLKWKKYTIQKCSNCKLIFSTPLPTDEELEKFYQGFLFDKPEEYEIQAQVENRKKEITHLFDLPEESDRLSGKKFLDYGAGTGAAYKATSDLGADSYYFDIDEQAKEFSKEKFGLIDKNVIDEITECEIKFDYIFSDNVIEHVKDPQEFTVNLIDQLQPGGSLVIKTPNAGNTSLVLNPMVSIKTYFLRALKYNSLVKSLRAYATKFWTCDPPRHIYAFSKDSFDEMMANIDNENLEHEVQYYKAPWFRNTITRQFFTRDKRLTGLSSIAIRILLLPIIPFEVAMQITRRVLINLGLISPAGIILSIHKSPAASH